MLSNPTWIAFNTIFTREIRRFMRIWIQTLLPPAITMILYFVIFGSFIGSRVGTMQGVSFMQYIAPGLIMMSIITSSFGNVVASFFSSRYMRNVEEILVSPTPNYIILLGYILGGICRGIVVGIIITAIALFFTHLSIHHLFITIFVVIATASLFSLAGFTNALFAKKFDDTSVFLTFVLTPLTYFGGVFYSMNMLSPTWKLLSHFNPIIYMVSSFRYGILGITDIQIPVAISILVILNITLFALNLTLLNKGYGIRT